jgi:hypothetical protein
VVIGSEKFFMYDLYSYELKTIIQSKLKMKLLFDDYGLYDFNGKFYCKYYFGSSNVSTSELYLRRL